MQPQFITLSNYAKDITGQRFGRLVALGPIGRNKNKSIVWLCVCDCGNEHRAIGHGLVSGATKSCGCVQKEKLIRRNTTHGMTYSSVYRAWAAMVTRCTNSNQKGFSDYGGRGITCGEWQRDFQSFHDHVSALPHCGEKGYSLDRIDNSLGYFAGNVRWATNLEQCHNKRNNHLITYEGKTMCISAWEDEIGVNRGVLSHRINAGWDLERAFTTPVKKRKNA